MSSPLARYWRVRFRRWGRAPAATDVGYTVLVPVPGDLPVFLDLALSVLRHQTAGARVATVVVPDVLTPEVLAVLERHRVGWTGGRLELRGLVRPERWLLPRLGDPGKNHAVQITSAMAAVTSEHVVLHDADLFALSPRLHDDLHAHARREGADVVGISPAWDPWFAEHGLTLAATWEMCARTSWVRSVPPHRLMAHDAELLGEVHTFDTTFWAQCHARSGAVRVLDVDDEFVHLSYVISTYRNFRRSSGPFADDRFRLLLIRIFTDVFDRSGADYALPRVAELARGLTDPAARVVYDASDRDRYAELRGRVELILGLPWADPARTAEVRRALAPFDEHFAVHDDLHRS